jgi:hypothetical protein
MPPTEAPAVCWQARNRYVTLPTSPLVPGLSAGERFRHHGGVGLSRSSPTLCMAL